MRLDLGLLFLRVTAGSMMLFGHGFGKLMGFSSMATRFPSIFGLGSTVSLSLAIFAEFFCALAVIIGLKTRLAAIPLVVTMLVAALLVHSADPWSKKEFALLYAIPFATLIFTGGGRFALDLFLGGKRRR